MKIVRTYKFRLKPTPAQEDRLNAACAAVRMVYNAANEQRRMYGRSQGKDAHGRNSFFNKVRQAKELGFRACKTERAWDWTDNFTEVKKKKADKERTGIDTDVRHKHARAARCSDLVSLPGLKDDPELAWMCDLVYGDAFSYALDSLDQAWNKFFDNIKNGESANLPAFRNAREDNSIKFRAYANGKPFLVFGGDFVKIPKIGYIRYVKHKRLRRLNLHDSTVVKEGDRWFICVVTSFEKDVCEPEVKSFAGIDLGTKHPVVIADSTGDAFPSELAESLRTSEKLSKRQKKLQRRISHAQNVKDREARRRGKQHASRAYSNRMRRKSDELARLCRKEAARKRLGLHQITTKLVKTYSHIGVEKLSVKSMTESGPSLRKKGKAEFNNKRQAAHNKAFLDVPKYMFRLQLEYKAAARGHHLLAVDPKDTSRKCIACGNVSNFSRVEQSTYYCTACGHLENADEMAARNILKKAFPNWQLLVDGTGAVAGPRKTTPISKGNSEETDPPVLVGVPAASNSVVSPIEVRIGSSFSDIQAGYSVDPPDGYEGT